jgi:hypothetical protein
MSSKIATREIREHRLSLLNTSSKHNAMKDRNTWTEPPPFLLIHPDDKERIPIRNANHETYQLLGTTTIWNKYINLGYYMFDDCMQFHKVWKSTAKDSVTQRNKIIWQSYHFHRMNDIQIPIKLSLSALNTARPYLKEKEPDFILATDIEHEEKEFFAACNPPNKNSNNSNSDSDEDYADEWTEVTPKKTRKKSPPTSPIITPKQPPSEGRHPADNKIEDLKQACITPVPSTTPEGKNTSNQSESDPNYVANVQEEIQQLNNTVHGKNSQITNNAIFTNCTIKNDSSKRSHDKLSTSDQQKANDTTTINNLHNHDADHNQSPQTCKLSYSTAQKINETAFNDTDQSTYSPDSTNKENNKHTAANEQHSTTSQNTSRDFVPINDGTLRITIKWKPLNYESVTQDEAQWNEQATKIVKITSVTTDI